MLSMQPSKAVNVLVGFHDAVRFYESQDAHENTILFTAYNSQKTMNNVYGPFYNQIHFIIIIF